LRIHESNSRWSFDGLLCGGFRRAVPELRLGLLISTARADSEERKVNRDRAIRAVKQSFVIFIALYANLFSEIAND
jgi:hypothetical protein